MLRFSAIFCSLTLATLAAAGCASGGNGTGSMRDTGPAVSPDSGTDAGATDAFVSMDDTGPGPDAEIADAGPIDTGPPPPGDERSSTALVPGGHVSTSPRYRLVTTTLGLGASAPPHSSRYVLRENILGRIGEPTP